MLTTGERLTSLKAARASIQEYYSNEATLLEQPYLEETMERLSKLIGIWAYQQKQETGSQKRS